MVDMQAVAHGLGRVVRPDDERRAAGVADAVLLRRIHADMITRAAAGADAPPRHAFHDVLVGNLKGKHDVEHNTVGDKRFRLGDRPGHAVEDESVGAVALREPFLHNVNDHVVRHKLAFVDVRLGRKSHACPVMDGGAQDVAGRNGGDTQFTG